VIRIPDGFADRRLAATYDTENAGRADIDWYLALAQRLGARDVIDLGCGTGVLAVDLAARGHRVTAIDPAAAMLEIARGRPGGDRVTWILGDATAMPSGAADLVTMTGHVAQVFLTDDDWDAVLRHARRALRPGGHLAFESRNPGARAWTSWTREASLGHYAPDGGREFTSWVETVEVADGIVRFEAVTVFADTGETIVATDALRFRTEPELRASLTGAGFAEPEVGGGWDGSPVGRTSRELIVVAAAAPTAAQT
jgi:ubiquinone/menaquinone biosynthesis C-methylase UbiE